VIEGYRELGQTFEPLDTLLQQEEYVDLLRLFRNATFHYQEDPMSEKIVRFLDKRDSEHWIRELNRQFQAFFLKVLPIDEALQRLEKRTPNISVNTDCCKRRFAPLATASYFNR
jgi:hypothetical protein